MPAARSLNKSTHTGPGNGSQPDMKSARLGPVPTHEHFFAILFSHTFGDERIWQRNKSF